MRRITIPKTIMFAGVGIMTNQEKKSVLRLALWAFYSDHLYLCERGEKTKIINDQIYFICTNNFSLKKYLDELYGINITYVYLSNQVQNVIIIKIHSSTYNSIQIFFHTWTKLTNKFVMRWDIYVSFH